MFAAERDPLVAEHARRPGVRGEHDRLVETREPRRRSAEPLRPDVRLAVDGRDDVAPGLVRRRTRPRAIGREAKGRRRPSRPRRPRPCPARLPRRASRPTARRGRAGALASRSTSIRARSSGIDRSPLRSPASTWATGTPSARRGAGAGEGRVGVAEDERRRRAAPPHDLVRSARSASSTSAVRRSSRYAGSGRPSSSKKTGDSSSSQCCPVWTTTSSIPASRSATESGAALTNCGRLPTTVRTFIGGSVVAGACDRPSLSRWRTPTSRPSRRTSTTPTRASTACGPSSSARPTPRTARSPRSRSRPGPCGGCGRSRTPSRGSASGGSTSRRRRRRSTSGAAGCTTTTSELLVVNWQAPAARPFYVATPGDPHDVTLRRRFRTEGRRLLDLSDETLDGSGSVAGGDFLLDELERSRDAAHARHRRDDPGRPVPADHPRPRAAARRPGRAGHREDRGRAPSRLVPALRAPRAGCGACSSSAPTRRSWSTSRTCCRRSARSASSSAR